MPRRRKRVLLAAAASGTFRPAERADLEFAQTSVLVGALLLISRPDVVSRFGWAGVCIPLALVLLHPKVVNALARKLAKRSGTEPPVLRWSHLVRPLAWMAPAWLVDGARPVHGDKPGAARRVFRHHDYIVQVGDWTLVDKVLQPTMKTWFITMSGIALAFVNQSVGPDRRAERVRDRHRHDHGGRCDLKRLRRDVRHGHDRPRPQGRTPAPPDSPAVTASAG